MILLLTAGSHAVLNIYFASAVPCYLASHKRAGKRADKGFVKVIPHKTHGATLQAGNNLTSMTHV